MDWLLIAILVGAVVAHLIVAGLPDDIKAIGTAHMSFREPQAWSSAAPRRARARDGSHVGPTNKGCQPLCEAQRQSGPAIP